MKRLIVLVISIGLMLFTLAATIAIADEDDKGMTVVAAGGGSAEDVLFQNGQVGDTTFSFFAGYDKNGDLKGSFFAKRVFQGEVTRTTISTEITDLEVGQDDCVWMRMEGIATFKARWISGRSPDNTFTLEAWDCDGDGIDMIWFEVRNSVGGNVRTAVSLADFTEVDSGNILILPYVFE